MKKELSPEKLHDGAIALLEEIAQLFDDLTHPTTRDAKRIAQAVRYARHLIEPTALAMETCPQLAALQLFDAEKGKAALEYSNAIDRILLKMDALSRQLNHWRNVRLAAAGLETFVAFAFMKRWVETPAGVVGEDAFRMMKMGLRHANARKRRRKTKPKAE